MTCRERRAQRNRRPAGRSPLVPELVAPILARLPATGWPLVMEPEDKWYRAGDEAIGQRQFVVADPDGYRLRLAESLGPR